MTDEEKAEQREHERLKRLHELTHSKQGQAVRGFFDEFRAFAVKGNVLDLAVAVVVGTAFNKIVDSLVNDIIMQAIAMIFGKPSFGDIVFAAHGGAIKIGSFLNNIVNFLIVAFSVFLAIKFVNRFMPHRNVQETMPASDKTKQAVKEDAKAIEHK